MEYLLVYDYNLSWFHRDQHIVDAHSDNFQIDVMLFLLSHKILFVEQYVMVKSIKGF